MKKNVYAPFVRQSDNSLTVMLDVLAAMLPAAIWGVYVYGPRCITVMCVSVISAILFDLAFSRIVLKSHDTSDISSVVTGLLISFAMPVAVPLWLPVFAAFFGVIIAKALFGGIGRNIFNPAAVGICVSYAFFPGWMDYFTKPFVRFPAFDITVAEDMLKNNHVVTALDSLKLGTVQVSSIMDDFYGFSAGAIGELSSLLLLVGLAYLLVRRTVHFNSAFSYVMTIVLLSYVFCYADCEPVDFIKLQLFTGPTMLILVFMLNDYTTTPTTSTGRTVFAVLLGAGIVGIRYFGPAHYGEYFVLVVMNALSPFIEKYTYSRVFGSRIRRTA